MVSSSPEFVAELTGSAKLFASITRNSPNALLLEATAVIASSDVIS